MGSRWRMEITYLSRDGEKATELKTLAKKDALDTFKRMSLRDNVVKGVLYETPLTRFGNPMKERIKDRFSHDIARAFPFDDEIPF